MRRRRSSCLALLAVLAALLASPGARGQCSFLEDVRIAAGDAARGDAYGGPLSAEGDVLVVGAPLADVGGPNTGAAYVHRRVDGVWVQEQKLTAGEPQPFANHGIAVDVEGDLIAVGAFFEDVTAPDDGAVQLYTHDGRAWQPGQRLTASNPAAGDRFGRAVALHGDWLAVGSYRTDDLGVDSGSVYVFHREGGTWVETQQLFASDGAEGDLFGVDLEFSGNALLVGAYFDTTVATMTGSGYVFRYDGQGWVEEQKLVASDAEAYDTLGAFVSIDGDTAVMGAYGANPLGVDSGAAYVYEFNGSTWTEVQRLAPDDGTFGDEFGWGIAVRDDVLAVGAYKDDQEGIKAGSAYVYRRAGGAWLEERKLLASDASAGDFFATDLSLSGTDLWIGAIGTDDAGADSGSAYRYDVRPLRLDVEPPAVAPGELLTLATGPGQQGDLAALFLVDVVGGVPFVYGHIVTLPFGVGCRMEIAAVIPPGLSGIAARFQSFGVTITGKVERTNIVTVSFR